MNDNFDWTDERDALLRKLWAVRPMMSATEIAERLGTTKHSIIGKARRLKLPGRDSPIKPCAFPLLPQPRLATGSTLPPLPSEMSE